MAADNFINEYIELINRSIKTIAEKEHKSLERSGLLIANAIKEDLRIHIFGTGSSSSVFAFESFYKPGTFPQVNPFFEQGFMNSHGAMRARMLQQRVLTYGAAVPDYYKVSKGDVLMIVNTHGVNNATIEAVTAGADIGAVIIGISSFNAGRRIPEDHPDRHSSGLHLSEMKELDAYIDLHISELTAAEGFGGIETPVLSFVANALVSYSVDAADKKGIRYSMWMDEYSENGAGNNRKLESEYRNRIRHL